jgi:hypothetical protein
MALNLQDFLMNGLFNKIDEVFLFVIKKKQWVEALIIDLRSNALIPRSYGLKMPLINTISKFIADLQHLNAQ